MKPEIKTWPIGANWHTNDEDGEGVFHVTKPAILADHWYGGRPNFPSKIDTDGTDWRESLQANPLTVTDKAVLGRS